MRSIQICALGWIVLLVIQSPQLSPVAFAQTLPVEILPSPGEPAFRQLPNGGYALPNGVYVLSNGVVILPDGGYVLPNGKQVRPDAGKFRIGVAPASTPQSPHEVYSQDFSRHIVVDESGVMMGAYGPHLADAAPVIYGDDWPYRRPLLSRVLYGRTRGNARPAPGIYRKPVYRDR